MKTLGSYTETTQKLSFCSLQLQKQQQQQQQKKHKRQDNGS